MDNFLFCAGVSLIALIIIWLSYLLIHWRFVFRFRKWQKTERLAIEEERDSIRKDAIAQSRSVLGGKFAEQIAPFLPDFKYDPTDVRFIGSPFDLIILPGLAIGEPQEIVLMEIKTGKSTLSPIERKVRQLVENNMVRYEIYQPSLTDYSTEE
ncbi:MAG: Holliday junction resolvase [Dehalococcoidia bacterium]|nr:Holliday junction resolvase [Dehalococcoidia bacterium]